MENFLPFHSVALIGQTLFTATQYVSGTKAASKLFSHAPFLSSLCLHFIVSWAGPQIEIEHDA